MHEFEEGPQDDLTSQVSGFIDQNSSFTGASNSKSTHSTSIAKEYPQPPQGSLNKIRVIVRVRPFLEDEVKSEELSQGHCMRVVDQSNMIE